MITLTDQFRAAVTLFVSGNLTEAEEACRRILAKDVRHADTLHLAGMIALQRNDLVQAEKFVSRAIAHNGRMAPYHSALGKIHHRQKRLSDADACFARALKIDPKWHEALVGRGTVQIEMKAVDGAMTTLTRAITFHPNSAEAHDAMGVALKARGQLAEAISSYKKALALKPGLAKAHLNMAVAYAELGSFNEALDCCKRALEVRPQYIEAYNLLGTLCFDNQALDIALDYYREALRLSPTNAHLHLNLGLNFRVMGRFKEAAASLECAVKLRPDLTEGHIGLALIAELTADFDGALKHYEQALAASPGDPATLWNRALAFLRHARLPEGWKDVDARWDNPKLFNSSRRPFSQPTWQGESFDGALLVWHEQGIGDQIINASMIPDLLARGIPTVIECDERLVSLFQRSWPAATVVASADPPELPRDIDIARQSSIADLGKWLRPDLSAFPKQESFLKPDVARRDTFRRRLKDAGGARPIIGISWSSKNNIIGTQKSSQLAEWGPILEQSGFSFVDLQYGDTAKERAEVRNTFGTEIIHFEDQDNFRDLDGLAALISSCDLVVTVSNTTAHLAGALGAPVWALIPSGIGLTWYWFQERTDCPWYPSAKLFRQKRHNDWQPIIKDVAKALKKLPRSRSSSIDVNP